MKDEHEFFAVGDVEWQDTDSPGVTERVLTAGPVGTPHELTRLTRWAPGLDTSAAGVIRHDWFEEVLVLEGELEDLTLRRVFGAGHFASRPPGMPHGPYRTSTGCVMLEIRHPV